MSGVVGAGGQVLVLAGAADAAALAVGGAAVPAVGSCRGAFLTVTWGVESDGDLGCGPHRRDWTQTNVPATTNTPTTASHNDRFDMSPRNWVVFDENSGRYQKLSVAARVMAAPPTAESGQHGQVCADFHPGMATALSSQFTFCCTHQPMGFGLVLLAAGGEYVSTWRTLML